MVGVSGSGSVRLSNAIVVHGCENSMLKVTVRNINVTEKVVTKGTESNVNLTKIQVFQKTLMPVSTCPGQNRAKKSEG